jgi:toxin CcdB
MRQFDVFRSPSPSSRKSAPFLVLLQSDLTITSTTVVVAPLIVKIRLPKPSKLFPQFGVEGQDLVLAVNELAAIRQQVLREHVTNLKDHRDSIIAAPDLLFLGIMNLNSHV